MTNSEPEHTAAGRGPRWPVDRDDGFFGDMPEEDRPQGRERRNRGRPPRKPTFAAVLMALVVGAFAGVIVWWSLLEGEGRTWMAAIAVVLVVAVAVWRGFEPAIAAAVAASVTVVGLWVYTLAGDDELWDSIVEVAFVGVGTLLALIVVGGVTAAITQGVRTARRRRRAPGSGPAGQAR